MNYSENDRPPKFALAFFRWFCHPEFREDIEGDLLERFHNRATKLGSRKAKRLFIIDVLFLFRLGIINYMNRFQEKNNNIKTVNWKKLVGINLLVILMMISPFIPGPSNKMVDLFSVTRQVIGFIGLILVPLGLAWTIIGIRKLKKINENATAQQWDFRLAIAASLFFQFIFLLVFLFLPNPLPKIIFLVGLFLVLWGLFWR